MAAPDDRVDLLLADAEERRPVLGEGLPGDTVQRGPKPRKGVRGDDSPAWPRTDADLNDLPLQKWAVIAPECREGDRQLEAIAPLLRLREAEQGAPARVYRVPPDMDAKQSVSWRDEVYWTEDVPEDERPLYLLRLGDLHEMSTYQSEADARAQGRPDRTDRAARGHLWMLRNDLRGYVLLGDPAARLPLQRLAQRAAAPPSAPAEVRPAPATEARIPASTREDAVLAILRGDEAPRAIAERAGMSLETLFDWTEAYRAERRAREGRRPG